MNNDTQPVGAFRQRVMYACAYATRQELSEAVEKLPRFAKEVVLRAPEPGLVMVRGRVGGDGAAFNCGEVTVTRAAIAVDDGIVGYGHLLGRDRDKARLAALMDASAQYADRLTAIEQLFLIPVEARLQKQRQEAAQKAAATRVDFVTLVRGED